MMAETVKATVSQAYEEKAEQQGHLTGERMQALLEEKFKAFGDNIKQYVSQKLDEIQAHLPEGRTQQQQEDDDDNASNNFLLADGQEDYVVEEWENDEGEIQEQRQQHRIYAGNGRFWDVPLDFVFPRETPLKIAWRMWLQGMEGNQTTSLSGSVRQAPVRPFRHLKLQMLPKNVKLEFTLHWRPILSLLQEAPGLVIPRLSLVDDEFIESSFSLVYEYLKTRVSYIFQNERLQHINWAVSYWSKKVSRSSILKDGTEEDIGRLPPSDNHRSKPRVQKERRRTNPAGDRRIRRRVAAAPYARAANNSLPAQGVAGLGGGTATANIRGRGRGGGGPRRPR